MKSNKKKTQIVNILQKEDIYMQDPDDETCLSYFKVYIDDSTASNIAEKILAKFGITIKNK